MHSTFQLENILFVVTHPANLHSDQAVSLKLTLPSRNVLGFIPLTYLQKRIEKLVLPIRLGIIPQKGDPIK